MIEPERVEEIKEWQNVRNYAVHTDKSIGGVKAKEIVDGVIKIVDKIDACTQRSIDKDKDLQ